jgi:beta-glucosidase
MGLIGLLCPAPQMQAQEVNDLVWPAAINGVSKDPVIESRVAAIVASMSLEEKVGQMIQAEIQNVTPADAARYGLGSVLNGGGSFPGRNKRASPEQWTAIAAAFDKASRERPGVAVPILWGTDAVHGHNNVFGATLFPHNIGIGASGDEKLALQIAAATAREVRATGIQWAFAPTLAVTRDIRWGRAYESFSSEPAVVSRFADAYVKGLQGAPQTEGFLNTDRVIATAKHFIGDGGTTEGIDQGDARLTDEQLMRIHAPGYYAAIAAGVQTVMVSFSSVNGEKMHAHRRLLSDILKGRLGFDGFVVSDWNGIGQVPGCTNSSCPQAINAGIDMIMAPEDWRALHNNIVSQVRSGQILMSRIDDAVTRILRVKARLGMLSLSTDNPTRSGAVSTGLIGAPTHRALAREAVRKSLVLLKNERNVLPLRPTARLLVLGDTADDIGRQSGGWTLTWQGSGNERADFQGATSILEGIRAELGKAGGKASANAIDFSDAAPDALVVVTGEDPYAEGEGDISSLDHPVDPAITQIMEKMRAKGVPVITVFVSGRPRLVNPLINASDAFVAAWLPGSEGGGLADVLIGNLDGTPRFDFQGRLPVAWPIQYPRSLNDATAVADLRSFPVGSGLSYAGGTASAARLPEPTAAASGSIGVMRIFDRRPVPPNQLFIGDQGNWRLPVTGPEGVSSERLVTIRTVDRSRQGDARQIEWSGRGEGIVYFETTTPRDMTSWLGNEAALSIDIKVERPPTQATFVKTHCTYPCGAQANVTAALRRAPKDEWVRLSIDLACFVKSGLNPAKVTTIPLLSTSGKLSMSISNVRLVSGMARSATVSCSNR